MPNKSSKEIVEPTPGVTDGAVQKRRGRPPKSSGVTDGGSSDAKTHPERLTAEVVENDGVTGVVRAPAVDTPEKSNDASVAVSRISEP